MVGPLPGQQVLRQAGTVPMADLVYYAHQGDQNAILKPLMRVSLVKTSARELRGEGAAVARDQGTRPALMMGVSKRLCVVAQKRALSRTPHVFGYSLGTDG